MKLDEKGDALASRANFETLDEYSTSLHIIHKAKFSLFVFKKEKN